MVYAPWGFGDSHAQNGSSRRNLENTPHIFLEVLSRFCVWVGVFFECFGVGLFVCFGGFFCVC